MDMIPVYWLIALAVLLIIEIITLGLTTVWFAGGALIAFIASIAGVPLLWQFALFLAASFLLLFFTRPLAIKHLNSKREKTNYESLVGRKGKVIEKIDNNNQSGRVMLSGQDWSARTEKDGITIEPDTFVWVKSISGVKLIVSTKKEED